ncbi:DUF1858 domain-containing protein [Hoeflea sp. AS16]|uniref:DUF1858 domain-containing protein n=1 Tax=unclassified Hoeflea TaxID=2614931 RepID=UPI0031813EBC
MGMRAITLDTPMDLVMSRHPEAVRVLLEFRIHCVGCLLSSFHSVGDAAFEHACDADELLQALNAAIENSPES